MEISKTIEELLYYCHTHLYLDENDFDFYRNYLMHDLKIKKPYFGQIDKKQISNMEVVDHLFDQLVSYLINDLKYDMDDALHHAFELLGHLTPRPSEVNKRFNELLKIDSKKATDYFYNLSVHSNYVQKTKIDKNIVIKSKIDNHELIVTINLSKPEKSNKDIVKMTQSKIKQESYPLCVICKENVGTYTEYKNSLRIINLALNNQHWFMQYSPYGYFDQHLIVVSDKHIPMNVEKNNLLALLDYIDLFPHYFIGANADLPIVGGSILQHEHFQGGSHCLPILDAKTKIVLNNNFHKDIEVSILDWPTTAFCLKGTNKNSLIELANKFLTTWKNHDDEILKIVSKDHNTMTVIVDKIKDEYRMFIILRNNNCNLEFSDGIFHVRPSLMHIKKEGIGLIEAGGLFVLPPRLKRQLELVEFIACNPKKYEEILTANTDLIPFKQMIDEFLQNKYHSIDEYLIWACNEILKDIDVFKYDDEKHSHLYQFINLLNL